MQPKPDFEAIRRTWRGVTYDSQLEADWAATLVKWDMLHVYHPGRIYLPEAGVYEPDFQLDGDVLLEVKGLHNNRIEKVHEAIREGYRIVVARPGVVVGDNATEFALADWDGSWVVHQYEDMRVVFLPEPDESEGWTFHSATHVMETEDVVTMGIRWFKAVGDEDIV